MTLRNKKINELIKRELGKIILKEVNFQENILVTITEVKTSSDLDIADTYLGCIPEEKTKEVISILEKKIWFIQQFLNKKLKMRKIPKIIFKEDKLLKKAENIERILEKIKKEKND